MLRYRDKLFCMLWFLRVLRAPRGSVFFLALLVSVTSAHAGVTIQSWQTNSGAKVMFVENHDLPMLDVAVHFDAGSRRDIAKRLGRASLSVSMLQLGAGGMSEEVIAKRLADVGAQMGASFEQDRAGYSLRTLSSAREREQALQILAAVLTAPDFPEAVVEREKARVIAALKEAETQPASIADKAFSKAVFGAHPYGLPPDGEAESVAKLTRQDLLNFYKLRYSALNAVVAIIGDVTRAEAEAIAERMTKGLAVELACEDIPNVEQLTQAHTERIAHPASQAHILMGAPGMKRGDPDYFALYLGNYILGGGGFDSRILKEIRQKRGLAYSAHSYFAPLMQEGPFQIGLQTKKQDADTALKVAQETLVRFINEGPSAAELKQAKNNIILGFPLRIDSNVEILGYLGVMGFYELPLSYLDDFPKQIKQVTARQIQDAFKRRVHPDKLVTVIVGAPAK